MTILVKAAENAFVVIAITLLLAAPATAQKREASSSPIISTVAGCCEGANGAPGTSGYGGDGGPATEAELYSPNGVAVDATGNFYVADDDNCLIRKVTASSGVITTVAGTVAGASSGTNCAYSGDGGAATSAQLNNPVGIAADSAGNLFIADQPNEVIRKVTAATSAITTVAGCCETTGGPGKSGYGGDGGPATSAVLNGPAGVAVDATGNFYIADLANCLIRKVTVSSGIITTVAGTTSGAGTKANCGYSGDGAAATSAKLDFPYGVAVDSAGNLYIADTASNVIRKVTVSTGVISTVAGDYALGAGYSGDGGPATSAELDGPQAVAVDSAGNIFIADQSNQAIRMVTASAGLITTVAGCCEPQGEAGYKGDGGPATSAELYNPTGVALDATGNIYIADDNNQVIRKVTVSSLATTITTVISSLNPSTEGEAVTLTATVKGGSSPTGTVGFTSNGATISGCSVLSLSSSQAQCTTTTLPTGSDAIVATYSGDSNNAGSTGTLTQVVNASTLTPTTTTVSSSSNPSTAGVSVTFTAIVTPSGPPAPTGTVGFTSNGTAISGCSAETLSRGTALCATSSLAVGTDAIVATYSGDTYYSGSSGSLSQLVNPPATGVQFFSVTPCRVVDTRTDNAFSGGIFTAGETRSYAIPSGPCTGIPPAAVAYSLNVTVVPPAPLEYLTIWPTGEGQPTVSTLNSPDGRIKANAAIVPAGTGGGVSVYVSNSTQVVLDIDGYFATAGTGSLEFYPLTPCRVADTRETSGYASGLGSPSLVANTERDFPILTASGNAVPCDIPSTAQAYSLNFTAVPPSGGNLGYLTVWPTGESQPLVSTLNDYTGTVVANAALVPAGKSGDVAVYPSNATDLVIDVNGYFAPAGTDGLQLYALTPCRVLDTRKSTGAFTGDLVVAVSGSTCAPPSTAQAYVFNATVVPTGDLGYLTLWPDKETQPVVSTLNAKDGAIASNMAIVPNVSGDIDAYASSTTQLILDISAYFAP